MIKKLLLIVLFLSLTGFNGIDVGFKEYSKRYKFIAVTQCGKLVLIIYTKQNKTKLFLAQYVKSKIYNEALKIKQKYKSKTVRVKLHCDDGVAV